MATTLDVVNDCLATLGETPLSTLNEPHEFKAAAQRLLSRVSNELQSTGWWFNTEALTVTPAPVTGHMVLPGDALKWESGVRASDTLSRQAAKPWFVQRGLRLYDTRNRSYTSSEEVTGDIVRAIPFDELPPVMNEYVAAATVLRFQSNFDGDSKRREELAQRYSLARSEARSENIRQLRVNLIDNNERLSSIKAVTRAARRYVR